MKYSILMWLVLGSCSAFGADDVCSFRRGHTYCATNVFAEAPADSEGFQTYVLSGLTMETRDREKVSIDRAANKDVICNAILGTYFYERNESASAIFGKGMRWHRLSKNSVKCLVQWK